MYVAIHYHPVVMASLRTFYHSFASGEPPIPSGVVSNLQMHLIVASVRLPVAVCLDMRHFFSRLLIGRDKKEHSDWLIAKIRGVLIG